MRVTNMRSNRTGNKVANQFTIRDNDTEYFQSYETMIAKNQSGHFVISGAWNYSRTTSKYFNEWLRSYGLTDELPQIKKWLQKAKSGDKDLSRSRFTLEYIDEL